MKIGMLWFDNDPKADLETKINRAAAYYLNKYGQQAEICFIHPDSYPAGEPGETLMIGGVEIRPTRSILRNHLWIGKNSVDKSIEKDL